jgi:Leucine Rich Repeat
MLLTVVFASNSGSFLVVPLTEALNLSSNKLSGGLPSQLGELFKLRELQLDGNNLTGKVPDEVCALTTGDSLHSFKTDCRSGDIKCDCCTACS